MARLGDAPESVVEQLQLPRELFERQASFYAGYAETLADRRAATDREPVNDTWERLANPRQAWQGSAAIASTYRLAAEFAVLVDTAWSIELAIRSAVAYLEAGLPFGLFLITGILDDRTLLQDPQTLTGLTQLLATRSAESPMSDPVQRSYLAMTLSARPQIREALDRRASTSLDTPLSGIIEGLASHALQPVGPQSVPMEAYLGFARSIRVAEWPDDNGSDFYPGNRGRRGPWLRSGEQRNTLDDIGNRFALLARGQADALRAAMRNSYLWERGAAPVNIVDLEYVAMCGNAMRRFEQPSWPLALGESIIEKLGDDTLAQIPIWVARRLQEFVPEVAGRMLELLHRDIPPAPAGD
jgi:hypothetical protein